ncbi:MAG: fibronectin type III-like domain-contianing protein, partial [Flavobacteriaceae bacterium]
YTQFTYSDIRLSADQMDSDETIEASVVITNQGKVKGKEVVQMYLQDPYASSVRPIKELKGFELIELEPGESKEVVFTISEKDLQFFNAQQKWTSEAGDFNLFIGTDSATPRRVSFVLN